MVSSKRKKVHKESNDISNTFIRLFISSGNDFFNNQNNKTFIINALFVVFLILFLKFTLIQYVPNVFELITIFIVALMLIFYVFRFITVHNYRVVDNKINGLISSFLTLILLIIILGAFI